MSRCFDLLIASLLVSGLATGCASVRQQLGRELVPVETEIELGEKFAAQIEQQEKVLANQQVQAYVRQIAGRLTPYSSKDRPEITCRFTVLDNPQQINAFALPGGPIYVYSGLLLAAENEAEVAGVLAHEIGHVVARHSANQLATQHGLELLTSLALGENPAMLTQMAAQIGGVGAMARFSRDDERQSDEYGVKYLVAAGYDPQGLKSFFQKLMQQEQKRSEVENLLASHPTTDERISRIEKMIARAGNPGGMTERERFRRETAALRR